MPKQKAARHHTAKLDEPPVSKEAEVSTAEAPKPEPDLLDELIEEAYPPASVTVAVMTSAQPGPAVDDIANVLELKRQFESRRQSAVDALLAIIEDAEKKLVVLGYHEPQQQQEQPNDDWEAPVTAETTTRRRGRPRTGTATTKTKKSKVGYQIDPARQAQAIYGRMLARYSKTMSKRDAGEKARQAAEKYAMRQGVKWPGPK